MDKDAVLAVIDRFGKALERRGVRIARMILFGSYATGKFHDGSDIDLVVVSDDFQGRDYWQRLDILDDALLEIWKPIEATPMTSEEWERGDSTIVQFARNGEVVFESEDLRVGHGSF